MIVLVIYSNNLNESTTESALVYQDSQFIIHDKNVVYHEMPLIFIGLRFGRSWSSLSVTESEFYFRIFILLYSC